MLAGKRCRNQSHKQGDGFVHHRNCSDKLSDGGTVGKDLLRGDETHFPVALAGHQDHAFGLDPADGPRREVRQDADLLAQHIPF